MSLRRIVTCSVMVLTIGSNFSASADTIQSNQNILTDQNVPWSATPYSYTWIGTGRTYPQPPIGSNISTDAAGDRSILSSDGSRYAFPGSSPQRWTAGSLEAINAPHPYYDNNPKNADFAPATIGSGLSNEKGYGTFVTSIDILTHYYSSGLAQNHDSLDYIYSYNRSTNGTFSPLTLNYVQTVIGGRYPANVIDINKNNLVLASVQRPNDTGQISYLLYDLHSGKGEILQPSIKLPAPSSSTAFDLSQALALDDQGRILFSGFRDVAYGREEGEILATPPGLSTDPMPTPEPTALLTLGVATIGLLIHHRRVRLNSTIA